ncbi:unnamed protein product [Prunus armeniaca]
MSNQFQTFVDLSIYEGNAGPSGVHYQLVAKTIKKHLKFQVEMEERMMTLNLKSYSSSLAW